MAFELTWLPQVLRAAGMKVAEQPGWAERGRGPMGKVRGIVCHHTATARRDLNMPTLRVITEGRADLPGPLAQLGLGRDGTYYVVAAGRANHAGEGSWRGVRGNSAFIGIEAENSGAADDAWPDVQHDAYRRGVAAILAHVGADADMCCGHKEYAPRRKPDPSFDMEAFRREVRNLMAGAGAVRPMIAAADRSGKATIRRGARGDAVKRVQKVAGVVADGLFGPGTEAAVRRFQRSAGLVPDGIVGPATWALIG